MIKENILNFTAVLSLFVLTGSSADAKFEFNSTGLETIYVKELIQPTSPAKITQLDELDKISLEYEGQRKVREAEIKLEAEKQRSIQMEEWAESNLFITNQEKIDDVLKGLIKQVGITPYGFGNTPDIWDCSGLTMWYLGQRNIEVQHSATAQIQTGTRIQEPIAGDLVGFQKPDAEDYFHVGVYVGGGLMVHSSNPEKGTNIQSIYEFAEAESSDIVFVRY